MPTTDPPQRSATGLQRLRRLGSRLLERAGGSPRRRLAKGAWLLQRPPYRLKVIPVGGPQLASFIVSDRDAARRNMRGYQQALSNHLSEELLATVLSSSGANVVLDVGANRGQFGTLLRRIGYTGRIVSYEPVSTNLAELREAAAADPDWIVEDFALGEAETTTEIMVSAGPGKLSSLLPGTRFGQQRFANMREEVLTTETVRIRRLDSVIDRALDGIERPRIFAKLDTQGYDLLALTGAGEYAERFVGLQSEVSSIPIYEGMPHLTDQLAAYEKAGLMIAGMFPVSRDDKSLAVVEFDVLMVRRDAA